MLVPCTVARAPWLARARCEDCPLCAPSVVIYTTSVFQWILGEGCRPNTPGTPEPIQPRYSALTTEDDRSDVSDHQNTKDLRSHGLEWQSELHPRDPRVYELVCHGRIHDELAFFAMPECALIY